MNSSPRLAQVDYWVPQRFRSQQVKARSIWKYVVKQSRDREAGASSSTEEVISFKEIVSQNSDGRPHSLYALRSKEGEGFSTVRSNSFDERNGKEMEDYRIKNHYFKTLWNEAQGVNHDFPAGSHAGRSKFCDGERPLNSKLEEQPISRKHSSRILPDVDAEPFSCPICMEVLDETDSSFSSCSCGFKLCLFCHHTISTTDGRCPGCRKSYDPKFHERSKSKVSKSKRHTKSLPQHATDGHSHGLSDSNFSSKGNSKAFKRFVTIL